MTRHHQRIRRSRPRLERRGATVPQPAAVQAVHRSTSPPDVRRAELLGHHFGRLLDRSRESVPAGPSRRGSLPTGPVSRRVGSEAFRPAATSPGRSVVQRTLEDFHKLHASYRTLGGKLGTDEDVDEGASLNREIVKAGNDVGRITGISFSETPLVYKAFVTSKQVIPGDVLYRPNTPLGNNLISLSMTSKGELLMLEILSAATKKEKRIHFTKGDWGVEEKDGGNYVVRVDVMKPVEERRRAVDTRGRAQMRPDMVLLGHEMGHLRDKLLGEEETRGREALYERLAGPTQYGSRRERNRRWQNIREWGATTYHENPLATELGLPERGEYNPTRTLDNEAAFHTISNLIRRFGQQAQDLATRGDDKFVAPIRRLRERFDALGRAPDAVRQRLRFEEFLDRNEREILDIMKKVRKLDALLFHAEQAMGLGPAPAPTAPIPAPGPPVPSTLNQALSWVLSWTPFG